MDYEFKCEESNFKTSRKMTLRQERIYENINMQIIENIDILEFMKIKNLISSKEIIKEKELPQTGKDICNTYNQQKDNIHHV